jgi:hypothetical protein
MDTTVMNCLEFYDAVVRREYVDNPERAEELYKYSNVAIKEALEGKSSTGMSAEQFGNQIFGYWKAMGMSMEQCENMLTFVGEKWRSKNLRREFDEEYVEYGFLSIEDGGRGETFD